MTITKQITHGIFAVTLATTMVLPMTAAANVKTTEASHSINISDLDLSTTEGQRVLKHRVKTAAKSVCGSTDRKNAGSLANARANQACVDTTMTSAMASVEQRYATAAL